MEYDTIIEVEVLFLLKRPIALAILWELAKVFSNEFKYTMA